MLISSGSARCSPEKRKLIFLPIRLLYQISWSVVKKFTKFLCCKSHFFGFFRFWKKGIFWEGDFKGGDCKGRFYCSNGMFLGKTVFPVRQKGVSPLLLPASVLQLPRCLVRICNLFLTNHKIANLTVSKNAIAAGKTDCKIEFASQMWATRPHLGSIFVKLLHRKTFRLPAACIL